MAGFMAAISGKVGQVFCAGTGNEMNVVLLFALLLLSTAPAFGSDPGGVIGPWHTEGDSSELEIFTCGEKLCGKVVWLKHPLYVASSDGPVGAPKVDRKNPDPTRQSRPILGLRVMEGLTPSGENRWENGSCYDPASGNTYTCKIRLVSPERLEVRGFIGIPLFGRTYTLTRRFVPDQGRKSAAN